MTRFLLKTQICPDGHEAESSITRSFLFVLAAGSLEAIFLFTATVFSLSILWIKLASGLENFCLSILLTLIYLSMSSLDVHSLFCLKRGLVVQSWPAWNSFCISGCHQLNSEKCACLCPPSAGIEDVCHHTWLHFLIIGRFSCMDFEHIPSSYLAPHHLLLSPQSPVP